MNACPNCFVSEYLRSIIKRSKKIGDCDFCPKTDVPLYNTSELIKFFRGILELYKPYNEKKHISIEKPQPLEKQITIDFPNKIFNLINDDSIKALIQAIIEPESELFEDIMNGPVVLDARYSETAKQKAENLQLIWEKFSREIITQNRFHIQNAIDLESLSNLLGRHVKGYSKGKYFYRARLSDKTGYTPEKMGNPSPHKARAGRANPQGISYLYLSNNEITTIYELRAILYDFITVGKFELVNDISIINLRETEIFDPIELSEKEDIEDFLVHLPFISELEDELSRPIRRFDNDLYYLPTQYLSEFIKSLGYDGIEFKSSQNPKGYNLAIFNPSKLKCIETKVYEIEDINFEYQIIRS